MSWVKLDDQMPDDGKVSNLSDAAFRAYVMAICFSARMLTDGQVPVGTAVKMVGGRTPQKILTELTPTLWHSPGDECASEHCHQANICNLEPGYYLIHNYLKYNPTRAYTLAKRERDNKRKGRGV